VLTWIVAGLTVIADWIGSNRGWFPYRKPDLTLAEYWQEALGKAESAVARAGILPAALPKASTPQRLLPEIAQALSPSQQHVLDLRLPEGPVLTIIEEVTGSGKTEAALLLAARLLTQNRADGLSTLRPWRRQTRCSSGWRAIGGCLPTEPSLMLAHGKRKLHEGFAASILEEPRDQRSARWLREEAAPRARPGSPTTAARRSSRMWASAPSIRRCSLCCRRGTSRCGCGASVIA
jgi:CRISPR-associated endonuclease/helicase Cas3